MHLFDRAAELHFGFRREQNAARAYIPSPRVMGNTTGAGPHHAERQVQFEALISALFDHVYM
jgi:hypothetical protein